MHSYPQYCVSTTFFRPVFLCCLQWAEFALFACLLVAVCIIFSIMAYFYTDVDPSQLDKLYQDGVKGGSEEEPKMKMKEKITKL